MFLDATYCEAKMRQRLHRPDRRDTDAIRRLGWIWHGFPKVIGSPFRRNLRKAAGAVVAEDRIPWEDTRARRP